MCLAVNKKACHNGYKIAKKNIPCYKVLLKRCDGTFETPYIRQPVDITIGINADHFQTELIKGIYIDKGIHSFTKVEQAEYLAMALTDYDQKYIGTIVLKAYIPKGTKYWIGYQHEFCSERIVFAKK